MTRLPDIDACILYHSEVTCQRVRGAIRVLAWRGSNGAGTEEEGTVQLG